MSDLLDDLQLTLIVILLAAVYFLPCWIAFWRRHRNAVAIVVVTALTGWTVVGWVFALVWAVIGESLTDVPDNPFHTETDGHGFGS